MCTYKNFFYCDCTITPIIRGLLTIPETKEINQKLYGNYPIAKMTYDN
jgi:hypothetical protein